MPPSGKIPVSTAALRTASTTLPISTRASRLAEYSRVKCGMSQLRFFRTTSGEITTHRAIQTIVSLDRVAFAGLDRADERSRQHHPTGLERKTQRNLPDLLARLLRVIEPFGGDTDFVVGEGHAGPAKKGCRNMINMLNVSGQTE